VLYLLLLAICAYTAQAPFSWFTFSISNGLVLMYALLILRTSRLFPVNTVLSSLRKLLKL
jgi:predicted membrane metal-binding protein